jgi:hypothetical protein
MKDWQMWVISIGLAIVITLIRVTIVPYLKGLFKRKI